MLREVLNKKTESGIVESLQKFNIKQSKRINDLNKEKRDLNKENKRLKEKNNNSSNEEKMKELVNLLQKQGMELSLLKKEIRGINTKEELDEFKKRNKL